MREPDNDATPRRRALFPSRRGRQRQAEAFAQLEELHEATVYALAAALELRDDETGGHAHRVTELAMRLAQEVDPLLAADPALRHGFLLHDIGKIGIPDAILLKPSALNEHENEQMQYHTTLGVQLVSTVPHLRGIATDVIAYHHEHWDGSGYPWGLRGEEIPIAARIFAVADAFDAITNDRPYKRASSVGAAVAEIGRHSGTQFDPSVIEAFAPIAKRLAAAHRVR